MITRARIVLCKTATVGVRRPHSADAALFTLAAEFPTVAFGVEVAGTTADTPLSTIDLALWDDRARGFEPFDEHIECLASRGPVTLVVRGGPGRAERAALEMLTRWQRLVGRRNAASRGPRFDALLARLRALHDVSKPLVRADWNHALDTWQWMLRLDGDASAAAQMAALLHDVERLESEADARVEHLSPDYQRFKDSHARRGSRIAGECLDACGVDAAVRDRVAFLVKTHESPGADPERALLNDADALSFFSQNSAGYVDYFGPEQARRKVAYTLARLRPGARAYLATMRLRADVARLLADVQAERGRPAPAEVIA